MYESEFISVKQYAVMRGIRGDEPIARLGITEKVRIFDDQEYKVGSATLKDSKRSHIRVYLK